MAKRKTIKETREEVLGLLRGGDVAAWNRAFKTKVAGAGSFRGAELAGASLEGVRLVELDFNKSNLAGATLAKARCEEIRLREADLSGADLSGADLSWGKLGKANLRGAVLKELKGEKVDLRGAQLQDADCSQANLAWSDLRGADLSGAKLGGAALKGAKYDERTSWPSGFTPPEGMDYQGEGKPPHERVSTAPSAAPQDAASFMDHVRKLVDSSRLKKALTMLKKDSFQLFAKVDDAGLVGVVKSQTDAKLLYACRLQASGDFSCCTQNLYTCGGLRGEPCKHLLVLVLGLTQGGALPAASATGWLEAAQGCKPALDADLMSEIFLEYKGAEAGELDWRPTETAPEDYYAF